MKKIVKDGATVLLVTHDVQTVRSFCETVVWLKDGQVVSSGDPMLVTSEYVRYLFGYDNDSGDQLSSGGDTPQDKLMKWGTGDIVFKSFKMTDKNGEEIDSIDWDQEINICAKLKVINDIDSDKIGVGFSFRNRNGLDIIISTTYEEGKRMGPYRKHEEFEIKFKFENILAPGDYLLTLQVEDRIDGIPKYYEFIENAKVFKVVSNKIIYSLVQPKINQIIK
jgi:hypothetical protein